MAKEELKPNFEQIYSPEVPEWFKVENQDALDLARRQGYDEAKEKYQRGWIDRIFGNGAKSYKSVVRLAVWTVTWLIIAPLVIVLAMGGLYGIRYTKNKWFPPSPPDPSVVQPIQAPEKLAEMIYQADRSNGHTPTLFGGPTNVWPVWDQLDEATKNIYRKKAIARSEGRPEGEPGQSPPESTKEN